MNFYVHTGEIEDKKIRDLIYHATLFIERFVFWHSTQIRGKLKFHVVFTSPDHP
jgi:hypothetical protein